MKVCNHCSTTCEDNSVFCPQCGHSTSIRYPHSPFTKEVISIWGWIARSLIPFIPVVGGIVYLIFLFFWSGDYSKEESFRNWAKAQLIISGISIVLIIILIVLIVVLAANA